MNSGVGRSLSALTSADRRLQRLEVVRKCLGYAVGIQNGDPGRLETRDREAHGYGMVVVGLDLGGPRITWVDDRRVPLILHLDAHAAQLRCHGHRSIGLLV